MNSLVAKSWWTSLPSKKVLHLNDGDVVCSDAALFLSCLKNNIADIVFLDPPFNLGKQYGSAKSRDDRLEERDYFRFMLQILSRCIEKLKDGGALYLYHMPKWAIRFAPFLRAKLNFRQWIAISMKNGFPTPGRLYPAHYALLYFSKGKPSTFIRPKISVPICRHCKKPIKDYGGYGKYVEKGINLSDVWDDLSPLRHAKYKNRSANELPFEIPQRITQMSGTRDGIFLDPFAGGGSTLIAARMAKMKFIACDKDIDAYRIMIRRLTSQGSDLCRRGTK